jgi:hypothetical protein
MTDSGADEDYDDIPFASPEIREAYEVALGRFMLAFNEIDNRVTELIGTVLTRLARTDLIKLCTNQTFFQKLIILDLLGESNEGDGILNSDISLESMRDLAKHRNHLAHGHFDQNPFDGSYEVVSSKKNVAADYPVEKLDRLTADAEGLITALRYGEAFYSFKDPPSGASNS